ncbi:RNA-binding protein [Sporosarcina pasteurii]|uniref:Photosystem II S4 domain protein n=1 Tax=Sporosarcina pasteurii TaxID=1474 RepID=A0A380BF64_SPOPA|nr:YlmH/Sll1252 family protein [Sporosarcina pasteurii]MDS9470511.1 YlmH/Sll1252 family protein [Sporosarcina pasteurii]QBQ05793.1 RNA-binding protein [Sporosarcina pasteurii]SUJ00541.1 photosystem II S4 domain protein [Sporosarcina pasteurii]
MESILQHFRKDEQPFIETVIGWIREVENLYVPKLTDYLNPRERYIVQSLASGSDLLVSAHGAFSNAERMRVLIYPNYYEPTKEDYRVTVFKINYASKFITLAHKDVLGSLMSLGIDRGKFGDIQFRDEEVQFAVTAELKDYIVANFTSIGKAKISVTQIADDSDILVSADTWIESLQVVSSMRLDAVIAAITNMSRQKAVSLVRSDKVRVNWVSQSDVAMELFEEDVLSIRGFGRFKIISIEGRTRKDKIRLITGKLE